MDDTMKAVEETKGEGKRWLEFEKRLLAYSAAAAAATIGFSPSAEALIQHIAIDAPDMPLEMNDTAFWDIDSQGNPEFTFNFFTFFSSTPSTTYSSSSITISNYDTSNTVSGDAAGIAATSSYSIQRLGKYSAVGPTMTFTSAFYYSTVTSSGNATNGWSSTSSDPMPIYIGFRFVDGANLLYGWAEVTVGQHRIEISQWAWEDDGSEIMVGDTINPPTTHASASSFANTAATQTDVSWAPGDGTNRIVVAREGAAVNWTPQVGTAYAADDDFSAAIDQDSGNKVVYKGAGTGFILTGLTNGTTYHFAVFEYNGTGAEPTYIKYIAGLPDQASETASAVTGGGGSNLPFGGCFISTIPPF